MALGVGAYLGEGAYYSMVAAYSRKYGSDNRSIVAERLNSVVMLCGSRVARRLKTVARETRLL